MVLREVGRRGGVGVAYSATRLPMQAPVRVRPQVQQPLAVVLETVLRGQGVAFGVLDGQVVLWRAADAAPAGVRVASTAGRVPVSAPRLPKTEKGVRNLAQQPTATGNGPRKPSSRLAEINNDSLGLQTRSVETNMGGLQTQTRHVETNMGGLQTKTRNVETNKGSLESKTRLAETNKGVAPLLGTSAASAALLITPNTVALAFPADTLSAPPTALRVRPWAPLAPTPWRQGVAQMSLLPPFSTRWTANAQTVNRISVNLVAGYAAGIRGVEVGGAVNAVRDSVVGLQAAGLLNAAGGAVAGAQIAGAANITRGSLEGIQSAGIWNTAHGQAQGWQSAGLVNVAHTTWGVWHAPRGAAAPDAWRTAEPLVQLAGLLNTAPRGIKGAQIAGLLNVAGKVEGVQIAGLLNIADSVAGVSLAPLNFVRHGYHALELSSDGTWPMMLALKLGGSPAFYTYFVGATSLPNNSTRWGVGYGVGGELAARRRLSLSLDAQAVQVNQDDNSWETWGSVLNMHTQFRVLAGWATGPKRRLRLVAGPTFNILVTERPASIGTPDSPDTTDFLPPSGVFFLDDVSTDRRTRTNGWLTATVGIRWKF